jgi:glycosyltransferase involved in cell wall biosynthesis
VATDDERSISLRVALLTYRGNPFSGGQGVYVRHLSRGLRDLGHEVTVLAGQPYPDLDGDVELVRVPGLDFYSSFPPGSGALRRIRRPIDLYEYAAATFGVFPEPLTFGVRAAPYLLSRRDRFDVVHDNQSLSYGLLALHLAGVPVAATVHHPIHIDRDYAIEAAESMGERLKIRRWYSFLRMQGVVARRLPMVITVSESSRRDTQRAFRIPPERLRTVYNGVDADRFAAPEDARRHPDRIVVVNSADQPVKGIAQLYPVLERLAAKRPIEATIVGEPRDRQATDAELRRRGLQGRVRFLGTVSHEELVRAYATSSVAVVPSLYEGFGLPAAEAMACALPVVAFDAGALPEVIGEDGEAGRIVPAFDQELMARAICEVLDDPDDAIRMGMAGRARVLKRFTWERASRETAALYEEVRDCSR